MINQRLVVSTGSVFPGYCRCESKHSPATNQSYPNASTASSAARRSAGKTDGRHGRASSARVTSPSHLCPADPRAKLISLPAVYAESALDEGWDPAVPARISGVGQREYYSDIVPVDDTPGARTVRITLQYSSLEGPMVTVPSPLNPTAQGRGVKGAPACRKRFGQ